MMVVGRGECRTRRGDSPDDSRFTDEDPARDDDNDEDDRDDSSRSIVSSRLHGKLSRRQRRGRGRGRQPLSLTTTTATSLGSFNSCNVKHLRPQPSEDVEAVVVVGDWQLGQVLGKGTSGTVYLGTSTSKRDSFAAIKRVKRLPHDHKEAALVHREIALMKLCSPHPHVVELFDLYESRSHLYLVTEYCRQGELFQYVTRNSLSRVERCRFYSQLVSALVHLSNLSISHRDIKFENLLLHEGDHGSLSIKVADMGMSTVQLDGTRLTTSCGSPHYAAPEVIRGDPYDGSLADVWSAGVCLYAMVARRLPFDDPDVATLLELVKRGSYELDRDVFTDPDERELVVGSLNSDPTQRLTLETISRHNYTFATIFVLEARFKENLENILKNDDDDDDHEEDVPDKFDCSERHFNLDERGGPDFDNVENLEVTVLASLGIVLKVATLDEVKAMLQHDRNHARLFYSKLLEFRTSKRSPISVSLDTIYRNDERERLWHQTTPAPFPYPPNESSSFPPSNATHCEGYEEGEEEEDESVCDPLGRGDRLASVGTNWNAPPPRASIAVDPEMIRSLLIVEHGTDRDGDGGVRLLLEPPTSAPPQPQKFPSFLTCLHEFGPVASAPPQIESFPSSSSTAPPPSSVSVQPSVSVSVSVTPPQVPLVDLKDGLFSPNLSGTGGLVDAASRRRGNLVPSPPSRVCQASSMMVGGGRVEQQPDSIEPVTTTTTTNRARKKISMHQRIRSLLSTPTSSPRASTISAFDVFASPLPWSRGGGGGRPPSPTRSDSSRLTRSNAYRSLGRAILGGGRSTPRITSSSRSSSSRSSRSSSVELSFAERVVLETIVPAFSPIPSLALAAAPPLHVRSKRDNGPSSSSRTRTNDDGERYARNYEGRGPGQHDRGRGRGDGGRGGRSHGSDSFSLEELIEKEVKTIRAVSPRPPPPLKGKTVATSTTGHTRTVRKKLSRGVLQFFHDSTTLTTTTKKDPKPSSPTATIPTTSVRSVPLVESAVIVVEDKGKGKEKRRPKALSIAWSNYLAVDRDTSTRSSSSIGRVGDDSDSQLSPIKKKWTTTTTNQAAIGPSRSNHLVAPSPLNLSHSPRVEDEDDTTTQTRLGPERLGSPSTCSRPVPARRPLFPIPMSFDSSSPHNTPATRPAPPPPSSSCCLRDYDELILSLRLENERLEKDNASMRSTIERQTAEIRRLERIDKEARGELVRRRHRRRESSIRTDDFDDEKEEQGPGLDELIRGGGGGGRVASDQWYGQGGGGGEEEEGIMIVGTREMSSRFADEQEG